MVDEKLFEQLKKIAHHATFPAPFAQMFNLDITEFREGHAHGEVTVDETWTNPFGIAHGGFLFTILDEIGYGGWVCAEYHPLSETADGLGWTRSALA